MLIFSQYFGLKYIDFILILFSLISLVFFIELIAKTIKNRKNDLEKNKNIEDTKTENIPQKETYYSKTKQILSILTNFFFYKIIPCMFAFVLICQTTNLLFPSLLNNILPSDSHQVITISNNKNTNQTLILLGRMSYSNDWIPIMPFNNLQFVPFINFKPSEKITYKLRTGIRDIDHIIIANISGNNSNTSNKKIGEGMDAIAISVPANDIAVYTKTMNTLNANIDIYFWATINYSLLYFTGIIGCVALFLILFFRIRDNLIKVIVLSSLFFILLSLLTLAFYLHIKTLLYL